MYVYVWLTCLFIMHNYVQSERELGRAQVLGGNTVIWPVWAQAGLADINWCRFLGLGKDVSWFEHMLEWIIPWFHCI